MKNVEYKRDGAEQLLLLLLAILLGCSPAVASDCVEQSYPHDRTAFTQGLVFHAGELFESTGRYGGHSSVRRVELETGKVLRKHSLPADHFGEGLAWHNQVLYQLTWHNGVVLKYDPDSLEPLGSISIKGEAWGLASDGRRMIMSDGSATLRYVNPDDFSTTERIQVQDKNGAVRGLNELEFVEGLLFANINLSNQVVIIDPATGKVVDRLDLGQLSNTASSGPRQCIPNGIAYVPESGCLLVTGKNCDRLLQINVPPSHKAKKTPNQ